MVGYGYAMRRQGAQASYFGPCVVRTRDAARKLLEWFLSNYPGQDLYWDLFPKTPTPCNWPSTTGLNRRGT